MVRGRARQWVATGMQQSETIAVRSPDRRLTGRERDCYGLLAQGLRPKEIAEELGIAAVTVEYHFKNARLRLGAHTREQTLAIAVQEGWISPLRSTALHTMTMNKRNGNCNTGASSRVELNQALVLQQKHLSM